MEIISLFLKKTGESFLQFPVFLTGCLMCAACLIDPSFTLKTQVGPVTLAAVGEVVISISIALLAITLVTDFNKAQDRVAVRLRRFFRSNPLGSLVYAVILMLIASVVVGHVALASADWLPGGYEPKDVIIRGWLCGTTALLYLGINSVTKTRLELELRKLLNTN